VGAKSEFHAWFVAQFGKRPGGRASNGSLWSAIKAGEAADATLTRREEWDAALDAALKGYVAGMDRQNVKFGSQANRGAEPK
jgi:hypothetical protein